MPSLNGKRRKRQFIVRKYVMASSAQEAMRLERSMPVDDVWVDQDWLTKQESQQTLYSNKKE